MTGIPTPPPRSSASTILSGSSLPQLPATSNPTSVATFLDRSILEAFGMLQPFGVAGRPNEWRAAKMAHRKRSLVLLCLPPRCWSFSLGQKHVWATNTSSDGCRASLCLASNLGVVVCPFSDFCDWLFMMNQMTSCLPCSAGPVMFHPCLCFFLCAWSEHRLLAANPA